MGISRPVRFSAKLPRHLEYPDGADSHPLRERCRDDRHEPSGLAGQA
jgi:hypothetical protein